MNFTDEIHNAAGGVARNSKAARQKMQKIKENARMLDNIHLEHDRKNLPGVACTAFAAIVWVLYAIVVAHDHYHKWILETENKWSSMNQPIRDGQAPDSAVPLFPVRLQCQADNCYIINVYSGRTSKSKACASALHALQNSNANSSCGQIGRGDEVWKHLCYSDFPMDGVIVMYNNSGPCEACGVAIQSVVEGPLEPEGMWSPLAIGRNQMLLVWTLNESYSQGHSGHERSEWFSTLLGSFAKNNVNLGDVGSSCRYLDHAVQIAPAARWVRQHVYRPSWIDLFGTVGGLWPIILLVASGLLQIVIAIGMAKESTVVKAIIYKPTAAPPQATRTDTDEVDPNYRPAKIPNNFGPNDFEQYPL